MPPTPSSPNGTGSAPKRPKAQKTSFLRNRDVFGAAPVPLGGTSPPPPWYRGPKPQSGAGAAPKSASSSQNLRFWSRTLDFGVASAPLTSLRSAQKTRAFRTAHSFAKFENGRDMTNFVFLALLPSRCAGFRAGKKDAAIGDFSESFQKTGNLS